MELETCFDLVALWRLRKFFCREGSSSVAKLWKNCQSYYDNIHAPNPTTTWSQHALWDHVLVHLVVDQCWLEIKKQNGWWSQHASTPWYHVWWASWACIVWNPTFPWTLQVLHLLHFLGLACTGPQESLQDDWIGTNVEQLIVVNIFARQGGCKNHWNAGNSLSSSICSAT